MTDIGSYNRQVVAEFRARNGAVRGPQGLSLLLLHHLGARSGTEYVTPLAYWQITSKSVAVIASNFGSPVNPAWYHNLIAHPATTVEIGAATWGVRARVADPAERHQLLERLTAESAPVAAALSRTDRQIPVVILDVLGARDGRT
jgi:deazaflavin-dependent oxidoreductase (nitroreductase family)